MPHDHLTIDDLSDREFLLVLDDVAKEDGWADSEHVAQRLDAAKKQIVSSRLSWLVRWGAVMREHERDRYGNLRYRADGTPRYTQRWALTPEGRALAFGSLKTRQRESLDKFDETQMIEVTRWLTTRSRSSSAVASKLIAREWRYGSSHKRNGRP
jgi:hypothetical protein